VSDEIPDPAEPAPPVRRSPSSKALLYIAGTLGVAGVLALGVIEARRSTGVPSGSSAPQVRMNRYGGGTLALSDLHGRVVMLDFWATWCTPCLQEMPSLVKLAKEYEGRGLAFVAASRDDSDTAPRVVDAYVKRHLQALGPHVVFAGDDVASLFQVQALPTLYFLDRQGKVTESQRGSMSEDELRAKIEAALK